MKLPRHGPSAAGMMLLALSTAAVGWAQELTAFTDSGQQAIADARPSGGPVAAAGLALFRDDHRCLLIQSTRSRFLYGVPLGRAVTGQNGPGGQCRVLLDDGSVIAGRLLTGIRGRGGIQLAPHQLRGFNRVRGDDRAAPGPVAGPGGPILEVTDSSGCTLDFDEVFLIDQYLAPGGGNAAYATDELRLRRGAMVVTAPWAAVARLERAEGPPGTHQLWLAGGRPLGGVLELRVQQPPAEDRMAVLGAPGADDYLVGRRGPLWYLLPLPELREARRLKPPPGTEPDGARLRLVDDQDGELILALAEADLQGLDPIEAALSAVGDLILLRTGTGWVGVHPRGVRSIRPAAEGRVVLETRSGELFAGRLVTPLRCGYRGATVTLLPDLFQRVSVRFDADWPEWRPTIAGNNLRAEVRLASEARLPLVRLLLVDREGTELGVDLRLQPTMEFPVIDAELGRLRPLDLSRVRLVERVAAGRWKVTLRDGETIVGPAGFRQPAPADPPGEPDVLDFLLGHSEIPRPAPQDGTQPGMALYFIPLGEVTRIVLENPDAPKGDPP